MATIISESQFRAQGCLYYEDLALQPPFIPRGYNPAYNPNMSNLLKILGPDDTWHDLSKKRKGYDDDFFNSTVANYLMTRNPANYTRTLPNIETFKDSMNFPEYSNGTFKNMTYESKVAATVEARFGLQTAETTITYDDIYQDVELVHGGQIQIKLTLIQKIIQSNGSLIIIPGTELTTFDDFISQYEDEEKNNVQKILSYFIKWYMHSTDLNDLNKLQLRIQTAVTSGETDISSENMPTGISISSDGGTFILGNIFKVSGSTGRPYLTIPNLLDSANTSISPFDPLLGIDYEIVEHDIVYPILSNFFSSDKLFLCYLLNEGKTFGIDGEYCFSLCVLNLYMSNNTPGGPEVPISFTFNGGQPVQLIYLVNIIRNSPLNPEYRNAATMIKSYIDQNGSSAGVARYYFGEVQKGFETENVDYSLKCGKSGAGVAYIGQVFDAIARQLPPAQGFNLPVQGLFSTTDPSDLVYIIKQGFDQLKSQPLYSHIPIADSRILKLWAYQSNQGLYLNLDVRSKLLILYELLADYKRTGDYQQIYAVLFKIIALLGGVNNSFYTFSSGDELAALVSRLCALGTILQTANSGTLVLYRNPTYGASLEAQLETQLQLKYKTIKTYYTQVLTVDLQTIIFFIKFNYTNAITVREQLYSLVTTVLQYPNISKLLILNAIHILSELIELSNHLMNPELVGRLTLLQNFCNAVDQATLSGETMTIIFETLPPGYALQAMNFIKNNSLFTLASFISKNIPRLSFKSALEKTIIEPLPETASNGSFNLVWLNLFFRGGTPSSINKKDAGLAGPAAIAGEISTTYDRIAGSIVRPLARKIQIDVAKKFLEEFNNFLSGLKLSELVFYIPEPIAAGMIFDKTSFVNYALSDIVQLKGAGIEAPLYCLDNYVIKVIELVGVEITAIPGADFTPVIESLTRLIPAATVAVADQVATTVAEGVSQAAQEQSGGGQIIQFGGANPNDNIRSLYNSINDIVIKTLSKCHSNMVDVFKNTKENQYSSADNFGNFLLVLTDIQRNYEMQNFCSELLFGDGDGLIPSLEFLCAGFVVGDFSGDPTNTTPVNLTYILNLTNGFGLESIQFLIFMLASSTTPVGGDIIDTYTPIETILRIFPEFYMNSASATIPYASITVSAIAIVYEIYFGENVTQFSNYITNNFIPSVIDTLKITYFGYQIPGRLFLTGDNGTPCSLYILLQQIILNFAISGGITLTQGVETGKRSYSSPEYSEEYTQGSDFTEFPDGSVNGSVSVDGSLYSPSLDRKKPTERSKARGKRPDVKIRPSSPKMYFPRRKEYEEAAEEAQHFTGRAIDEPNKPPRLRTKINPRTGVKYKEDSPGKWTLIKGGNSTKSKSTRRNKKTKLRKTYKKKVIKVKKNTYRNRLLKRTKKNKTRKYRHK
jgi:hypothetical protein